MTNVLKIGALVLALALIVGVCLFANSLVGNPISKSMAENTAKKHIEQNYKNTDYELKEVSYNYKDRYYHALISSDSKIDSEFTLMINKLGKVEYDNYEYSVTNGWNTAIRHDKDYRKAVETLIKSNNFPYEAYIGYGELIFVTEEQKDDPMTSDYALITNELTPGAYYDVNKLGASSGKLTVYIDDETVSTERMAEILLGIRKCFDDAGVGFHAIECVLEYPKNEDGFYEFGRVEVIDFLYSDIYEENLIERVEKANEAAIEYYGSFDKTAE